MKRLVYLSEATEAFSQTDIEDLSIQSLIKNRGLGITGYLCFSNGRFIQYLEGEGSVVTNLINTIKNDPRHNYIYEVESDEWEVRLFPSWGMRYISSDDLEGFNLEDFIELNLLYIKNDFPLKERRTELLWKHVTEISEARMQLTIEEI